jgi:hypothetical protein
MKHNTINVTTLEAAQQVAALAVQAGASINYTRSRAEATGHNFIFIWDTDLELVKGQLNSKKIPFTTSFLDL